jgi:starvation-inducible DNA-binding protein
VILKMAKISSEKTTACYCHLVQCLRDTVYLLNQSYIVHWNIMGPRFYSIHKLTQEMYEGLSDAIDTVAEHLRSLGIAAPKQVEDLTFSNLLKLPEDCFDEKGLISTLAYNTNTLAENYKELALESGAIKDDLTLDVAVEQGRMLKKFQWLLKSNLGVKENG